MPDPRLIAANGRVAAIELQGTVEAGAFVTGDSCQIGIPVTDLMRGPDRQRLRQLLWGDRVRVFERRDGLAFVQSAKDGYVGYVDTGALVTAGEPTHRVCVQATHLYPRPDLKQHETAWLSFGSALRIVSAEGRFFETEQGLFVPKLHLRPLTVPFQDPVVVAQMHFGVPYLWGGNSTMGIDCSGLVQAALLACGIACPGDSDQQLATVGAALPPGTAPERGDLFFWSSHLAMAVDGETMIHANAHKMAVSYEPIAAAIVRIEIQGEGPVVAHIRL